MRIIDLCPKSENVIQQAASLLVEGFKEHWPNAWLDMASAVQEVHECLQDVCR
jgi:aminoglycoside 6'-N-acetyltransferase I